MLLLLVLVLVWISVATSYGIDVPDSIPSSAFFLSCIYGKDWEFEICYIGPVGFEVIRCYIVFMDRPSRQISSVDTNL